MTPSARILSAALLASVVVSVLDVAKMAFGPWGGSWAELLTLATLWMLFFGCLAGFFALKWTDAVGRLTERVGARGADFLYPAPLLLFSLWVPLDWVKEHSRTLGVTGWVFVAVYALTCAALWSGFSRGMRWFSSQAPSFAVDLILAGLCWGGAALGFWLDARLLVGLYEDFHLGLFVGATFLCALGFWFSLPRLPRVVQTGEPVNVVLLGVLAVAFSASFLLVPWQSAPQTSLAFAKLAKIRAVFVEDPFAGAPYGQERSRARTTYAVPKCPKCNVLLLTVDALRADHVGAYGYSRKTTPELDLLATKSLRFTNAFTQATKTFDSLPSIYSGLYPSHLDRNYEHRRLKNAKSYLFYVDDKTTFLSHRFKTIGYKTAAFYGFHFGDFGYHRGFDHVVEDRKDITPHILRYLKKTAGPVFVSAHFHFPHEPYEKHPQFDFGDGAIDRYDSEVAYADQRIGKILELLEQRNLLENTIVIVGADHGEEFGEHGGKFHGRKLHRELLHVPLIVWHPHLPAQTVPEFVELVDIAPFLSEALDLGATPEEFDGQSLLSAVNNQRDPALPGAYSQNYGSEGLRAASLVTSEWRAILGPDVGGFVLFDKATDPQEQVDVAPQNPEVREAFTKLIQARVP